MSALQAPLPVPRTGKRQIRGLPRGTGGRGSPAAADVPAQVGSFQLAPVRILGTDQRVVTVPNSRCEPVVNLTKLRSGAELKLPLASTGLDLSRALAAARSGPMAFG